MINVKSLDQCLVRVSKILAVQNKGEKLDIYIYMLDTRNENKADLKVFLHKMKTTRRMNRFVWCWGEALVKLSMQKCNKKTSA